MNERPKTLTIGAPGWASGSTSKRSASTSAQGSGCGNPPARWAASAAMATRIRRGVRFIARAAAGVRLDEAADLLKLEDGAHCTEAREQAERKLTDAPSSLISSASRQS